MGSEQLGDAPRDAFSHKMMRAIGWWKYRGLVLSLEKWAIFTTKSRKMRGYEDWFNKVHSAQAQAPSASRGLPIASPAELPSSGGNDSELPKPVREFTEAGKDMDKEAQRLLRHIQEEELLSFKGTSVFEHRPNPADALRRAQEKTPPH